MDPVQTLTPETFDQSDLLPTPQPRIPWQGQAHTSAYQAQRFLKFMMPSIPVLAFSIDFLTAYILQARADLAAHQPINATGPFLGAVLLAAVVSLLCIFIYQGVLKIIHPALEER